MRHPSAVDKPYGSVKTGREYSVNGVQNQTDVRAWAELNEWAALMIQPKFISNRHLLGIGATNNADNFYLREFSLKVKLREHCAGGRTRERNGGGRAIMGHCC